MSERKPAFKDTLRSGHARMRRNKNLEHGLLPASVVAEERLLVRDKEHCANTRIHAPALRSDHLLLESILESMDVLFAHRTGRCRPQVGREAVHVGAHGIAATSNTKHSQDRYHTATGAWDIKPPARMRCEWLAVIKVNVNPLCKSVARCSMKVPSQNRQAGLPRYTYETQWRSSLRRPEVGAAAMIPLKTRLQTQRRSLPAAGRSQQFARGGQCDVEEAQRTAKVGPAEAPPRFAILHARPSEICPSFEKLLSRRHSWSS